LVRTLLLGAVAWTLVVCLNSAASFQFFRYHMPALGLLCAAAALGLGPLAIRLRAQKWRLALLVGGLLLAVPGVLRNANLALRASRNIADQQREVGRRLATLLAPGESVLVGDAGAIPYESGAHAIDAIGLGGYHGQPFARAAVLGEGAVAELLKALPAAERPAYFALYPSWFPFLTSTFGRQIDSVTIQDNVICGEATKGIYRANYSYMRDPGPPLAGLELLVDVGLVTSEQRVHLRATGAGRGLVFGVLLTAPDGRAYFDGGRPLSAGATLSLGAAAGAAANRSWVVRATGECSTLQRGGASGDPAAATRQVQYLRFAAGPAELKFASAAELGSTCVVYAIWGE
jgi:hypothetical protein